MSEVKLYELCAEYKEVEHKLRNLGLSDSEIADTLEQFKIPAEDKARNVALVIKSLYCSLESVLRAEKEIRKRRKCMEGRIESLKEYLCSNMDTLGITKIHCDYFDISLRECPDSVEILDERKIPFEYSYIKTSPNKTAIKDAIRNGEEVPGARLVKNKTVVITEGMGHEKNKLETDKQ